jgi:hypothetical protein
LAAHASGTQVVFFGQAARQLLLLTIRRANEQTQKIFFTFRTVWVVNDQA